MAHAMSPSTWPSSTCPVCASVSRCTVELWTQEGQRYAGKIREIAASADAMTRTYAVRVALDDADASTQLGQSARVYHGTKRRSQPVRATVGPDRQ